MCGVDGRDVIGEPVSVLRSLLLGHEGSTVVLTFARAVEADADGGEGATEIGQTVIAKFDVELVRGSPEYFARMETSRRSAPAPCLLPHPHPPPGKRWNGRSTGFVSLWIMGAGLAEQSMTALPGAARPWGHSGCINYGGSWECQLAQPVRQRPCVH